MTITENSTTDTLDFDLSKPLEIAVDNVVFREDLYPRIEKDPLTVQKYAADLTVLPPIEINQDHILIDGWHRWMAHQKQEAKSIHAQITQTSSDLHVLELAIERNAKHGLQLSMDDKQDMARKLYGITPERERNGKKAYLAKILSVSERVIYDWLSRTDKEAKVKRDKRILARWLACWTQQEIADAEGMTQQAMALLLQEIADLQKLVKPAQNAARHEDNFDPPIYNVWKQQTKTSGSSHYGNSEVRWLDNLLYLYTKPADIVVDPFAGGGSTIDLCKKRFRRYWVSDRKPIVERAEEIRQFDLTKGIPAMSWKDVSLVYLDPPYWKQAEGKYSDAPEDLANMTLDDFHDTLATIIKGFGGKMKKPARLALILQPTQWKAENREVVDHVAEMICRMRRSDTLELEQRFSVPYESQQCTAQMVEWAKAEKRCLVLTREIIVWRRT